MWEVWQDETGIFIVLNAETSEGFEYGNRELAELVCGALNL